MQLKDYIRGDRRGKEANRLERKAMNDPFLRDALDGFDAVPGDHANTIERLEKKIAHTTVAPANKRKMFTYWSAAATILLLIGFGAYFLFKNDVPRNTLAILQTNKPESRMMDELLLPQIAPAMEEEAMMASEDATKESHQTMPAQTQTAAKATPASPTVSQQNDLMADAAEEKKQEASEVVVVAYDTKKKDARTRSNEVFEARQSDSASKTYSKSADNPNFGEKEFQAFCQQKAVKNLCHGKTISVKVTFFVEATGKPSQIKFNRYTCEEAKKEIERLLTASPTWTQADRKVTMTIQW